MNSSRGLHVGVLGNGLSALAAAHFVQKAGHEATVLETDHSDVRLGRTFKHGPSRFDQFFQLVSEQDSALRGLLKELGIEDNLQWVPAPRRRKFWPIRQHQVALGVGLAETMKLALRSRLQVHKVSSEMDLMESEYSIDIRTDEGTRRFDALITSLPIDQVEDLGRELVAQQVPDSQGRQQTLVNVVFISSSPIWRKYSTFVVSNQMPFHSVSATTYVDLMLSVINVSGYNDSSDSELKLLALRSLSENYAEFQPSNVQAARVFRYAKHIPVFEPEDNHRQISARVGGSRLFLASRELGCSLPVCMNTDVLLAREAVDAFVECAPTFACGARQAAHAAGR